MMAGELPYDPRLALEHFKQKDPVLAALTEQVGPFGLEFNAELTPFEDLVGSIVYQQLSGRAAASILKRVLSLYGDEFPLPEDLLTTADDELRGCGLSRSKIRAVKDLASKTSQGLLPEPKAIAAMDNRAIIDAFTEVRGIGQWTVEMLLMFNLGRMDVLPATDLGVRRGYSVAFQTDGLPTPKQLLAHGELWKPYRSVASWYLWQAADPDFRAKAD